MSELPVLARCKKCGRGFVTVPVKWPAIDVFGPANIHYRTGDQIPICGGEIELTDDGRTQSPQDTKHD